MSAGTIRRKRDAAMRQEGSSFRTREIRQRHLPTKHCHGGSAPGNRRNPRILERLVVEAPCLVRRLRFPGGGTANVRIYEDGNNNEPLAKA